MKITIDDRKFLWLAVIVGAIFARHAVVAALLPFVLALALAAVIEPIANFIQAKARIPRAFAAFISLLAVMLAGGYVFLLVSTKVLSELVQMGALLQRYQQVPVDLAANLIAELNRINEAFDQRGLPTAVQANILQAVDDITRTGIGLMTQGINLTLGAVSRVPSLIVVLVIAFIATYFIVKDKESLVEGALSVVPDSVRERAREMQSKIIVDLVGFFKAQLILLGLTTVLIGTGLVLIGVNYWVTLALVAGVLDIIPVLGPGFLLVPWAVGAWTIGDTALAIKLLILFMISFLIRQIFQAKILGDFIGVHPLPMLMALYAGLHFFGIAAFIVAPVLVIVGKAVINFTRRP